MLKVAQVHGVRSLLVSQPLFVSEPSNINFKRRVEDLCCIVSVPTIATTQAVEPVAVMAGNFRGGKRPAWTVPIT